MLISAIILSFAAVSDCAPLQNEDYLKPYLNKKYELSSSENFDAVLEAVGVSFLMRQIGNLAKPVIWLTESNGVYTLAATSLFKDVSLAFRIGDKFDEETPDGRKVKSVVTQERNKLTHTQKGAKTMVTVREFTPTQVKTTVSVDNITSVRIYKAI